MLTAAGLFTMATFDVVMDPFGALGTGLVPPVSWEDRNVKAALFAAAGTAPELVVLGTSKVMKMSPSVLREATGLASFNFGVSDATMEDLLAIYRFMVDRERVPSVILVGVDPLMFRPGAMEMSTVNARPLAQFVDDRPPPWARWGDDLFGASALYSSVRSVVNLIRPVRPTSRIEPDGLLVYERWDEEIARGDFDFEAELRQTVDAVTRRCRGYDRLDPARVQMMRELVRLAHEHGTRVVRSSQSRRAGPTVPGDDVRGTRRRRGLTRPRARGRAIGHVRIVLERRGVRWSSRRLLRWSSHARRQHGSLDPGSRGASSYRREHFDGGRPVSAGFSWLAELPTLDAELSAARKVTDPRERFQEISRLAQYRLSFVQAASLDRALGRTVAELGDETGRPGLKVAWVGSHTVEHLLPSTHLAALRRGLLVRSWVAPFGMYRQVLLERDSDLAAFAPDVVVLQASNLPAPVSIDASASDVDAQVRRRVEETRALWASARRIYGAQIVHEIADEGTSLFGSFEPHVAGAPVTWTHRVQNATVEAAREDRILLHDTRELAAIVGRDVWHDPVRWAHARQHVSPVAAPLFGDRLARTLAAIRGLSRKCVVLDLDNTLWGGVVGDDGLAGLALGGGSAAGEAYQSFQDYLVALKQRGVLLAVCSKNDHATAREAFEKHPEMRLKYDDVAAFVANWTDKATNIREIADRMNIGLDSLVFFDDNPAERALVRRELPMVAVPEVPTEPALYVRTLADAGYFDAVSFTDDDRSRQGQYVANARRAEAQESATDMASFLKDLASVMTFESFDDPNLPRVVQLINKTNQFNVTTRRYTEQDVRSMLASGEYHGYHVRLRDRFGDNGLIAVLITRTDGDVAEVDTWLMSCRVLGRGVEQAMLEQLAGAATRRGVRRLIGAYLPTAKNKMVADLFPRLGFREIENETSRWSLDLSTYSPAPHHIRVEGTDEQ